MDNASNNRTFLTELGKLLAERDIDFEPDDRFISCFAHVINICCQHVIKDATNIDLADTGNDAIANLPDLPQSRHYEDIIKRDPIARARNIVRTICSSGLCRDPFSSIIKDGNAKQWFVHGDPPKVFKVPELELLRDVKTRWDSVYHMLRRLHQLQPVRPLLSAQILPQVDLLPGYQLLLRVTR